MRASVLVAAVATLVASPALASLIGDEIQARWQFRDTYDVTTTFLVGPGVEGDPWGTSNTLDIGDSYISIDKRGTVIGQAKGTVWTFSDLDWVDTPGEIVGVTASTNWTNWSDDFVTFGADYVRIDFLTSVRFDASPNFLHLELDVRHLGVEGIEIDIKPGSNTNPINLSGRGVVPVTILGSDTFDVEDVDETTLGFGPNGAIPRHDLTEPETFVDHLRDVNDDGFTDLLSHFLTQETGIAVGDTEVCITGETLDVLPFEGCNTIEVLAPNGGKP